MHGQRCIPRHSQNNVHIVIACAASPIKVALPSRLSHRPGLGTKSSNAMALTAASLGMFMTHSRNGFAHPSASSCINLTLSSSVSGVSRGFSRPRNPSRHGQLTKIWHSYVSGSSLVLFAGVSRKENHMKASVSGSPPWKKKGSRARILSARSRG